MIPELHSRPVHVRPKMRLASAAAMLASTMALTLPAAVAAQETTGASDWSFTVAPYFWGAGLSGEAGTLESVPPVEFDLSFKDILEDLEGAAMIVGQAQNGPWAISVDAQHVKTKSTTSNPSPAIERAELDATTQSLSFHVEYLMKDDANTVLWVSGGARYWNVETDLTISDGMNEATTRGSDTWWDPIIGVRGRTALGDRFYANGWAYIGGFGAGSDFMADLFAGLGYSISDRTSLVGGFRYQAVDRRSGGFVWDVEQYGPMVGLSFTF